MCSPAGSPPTCTSRGARGEVKPPAQELDTAGSPPTCTSRGARSEVEPPALGLEPASSPPASTSRGARGEVRHTSCHPSQLSRAMPATVIRRRPDVKFTVGATPKCRDLRTITFDPTVEVFEHEVEVFIQCDYRSSNIPRPEVEPSEWLWGNVVDGFYDPVIDLAVARFKAVSLANGTGPISHSDEYGEPSPHPEDVGPFFIDLH